MKNVIKFITLPFLAATLAFITSCNKPDTIASVSNELAADVKEVEGIMKKFSP
jgi:hypothetical protein